MHAFTARAAVIALFLLAIPVVATAQTSTTQKVVRPNGTVSGRVTVKDKGLGGATVVLRSAEFNNPYEPLPRATTDSEGLYRITDVGAGSYEVVVGAIAFVSVDGNARNRNLVMGEGENIENIDFSLVRGGVITGKIVDSEGKPAIQQQVRILRAEPPQIRSNQPAPQVFPVGTQTTDDRGVYRFFGLSAGRYKVAVGRGDSAYSSFNDPSRTAYKEIYYPDSSDVATAGIIEVGEGTETTNIDITLGKTIETFTAFGRVVEGEKPVAGLRFSLQRITGENRSEFLNTVVTSNYKGDFRVDGLIPGKYGVYLYSEANSELRSENVTFEIVNSDVSDVTIRLVKGGSISGQVVIEPENKRGFAKLLQMQVNGYVPNPAGASRSARATINSDGSFRLAGLPPGNVNLQLGPSMSMRQMKGFVILRLERDGAVQHQIELKDGEQLNGIRMVVSYGTATIRGLVNVDNGPLPAGTRFYVRIAKVGETRELRPPMVDLRGHFSVEGIPAGTYEVSVGPMGPNLKPRPPAKQTVVLQDDSIVDVTFTIDLAAVSSGPIGRD